ncbi:hypothetical protein DFH07DRAFT_766967 [Mycena maculata]|uniref:BTB domain-containing protein n=1 Tax=Mycena maculata TaxID=230809 RepID=A0AAD7K3J5_9AGAR|nr:hypothetical protein DFH07DRAFT_766967 [Mycena maculata]
MSDTDSFPPFVLRPPFDDSGADIILRSSEGIDFRVHRLVLSLASPFFKDMFNLPQPKGEAETPVISMSESALVLDRALRFWYPGAEPLTGETLGELRDTLEALILKYDMGFLVPVAKSRLRAQMANDPVSVFAISCRHGWRDVAIEAAKTSLQFPIRDLDLDSPRPAHLTEMTADTYYSLLVYHLECASVATSATSSLKWASYPDDYPSKDCKMPQCALDREGGTREFANEQKASLRLWHANYLKTLGEILGRTPGASPRSFELLALPTCVSCNRGLTRFSAALQAHIEREINSVELSNLISESL